MSNESLLCHVMQWIPSLYVKTPVNSGFPWKKSD